MSNCEDELKEADREIESLQSQNDLLQDRILELEREADHAYRDGQQDLLAEQRREEAIDDPDYDDEWDDD